MSVDAAPQQGRIQSTNDDKMLNTDGLLCMEADRGDLDSIVHIHMDSLPNDVFANLGKRFLYDFYMKTLDHHGYELAVVRSNDVVRGFCLVSDRTGAVMELVSARTYLLAARLLFFRPRLFVSAVLQFLQMTKVRQLQSAEIAFIAVSRDSQQKGIGKLLIKYAIDFCQQKQCRSLNTKTSNQHLARYYRERFNAREVASFAVFDQKYSVLEWDL